MGTNRTRLAAVLLALLVLAVTAGAGVAAIGSAQAQETTPTPTPAANATATNASQSPAQAARIDGAREAGLTVEQPHYVDSGVNQQSTNGTLVYEVSGAAIRLYPDSFGMDEVVAVRSQPDVSLDRLRSGTGWLMQPDADGSYTLTWEVDETVPTANGTTTERRTYQAVVQVSGVDGVAVVNQGESQQAREDAQKWRDINATAAEQADNSWIFALLPGDIDSEAWIQSALDKQRLVHNPGSAFGSGLTLLAFAIFSLGGALAITIALGWHARIVRSLSRRLNIFESIEDEEGSVATRMERQQAREKQAALQNEKHSEVFLPHESDAMREIGETPLEADINLWADTLLPSAAVAFKARAMAAAGYVGVVPDDVPRADGGEAGHTTDPEPVIEAVRAADDRLALMPRDEAPPDASTVDLGAADREWIDVLPVNDDEMLEFDPAGVEVDRAGMAIEGVEWTVEDLTVESGLEMRHFDSAAEAGRLLRQFLTWVVEQDITDADGRPRRSRYVAETWLRNAQVMDDKFGIPKQHAIDILEAAIQDDDPVAEGREMITDKELGKYA